MIVIIKKKGFFFSFLFFLFIESAPLFFSSASYIVKQLLMSMSYIKKEIPKKSILPTHSNIRLFLLHEYISLELIWTTVVFYHFQTSEKMKTIYIFRILRDRLIESKCLLEKTRPNRIYNLTSYYSYKFLFLLKNNQINTMKYPEKNILPLTTRRHLTIEQDDRVTIMTVYQNQTSSIALWFFNGRRMLSSAIETRSKLYSCRLIFILSSSCSMSHYSFLFFLCKKEKKEKEEKAACINVLIGIKIT
jgi:hypothetical protein